MNLGDKFRNKRVSVGVSQQRVADAARISRASYIRIEQGRMAELSISRASRVAAVLGLELAVRVFPGPNPIREVAHAKKLASVLEHVGNPLSYRTEVGLPQVPGRIEQRAWDALITGVGKRTGVEMEMRIRDAQALERRLDMKRRDDPVDGLMLLVADTRNNRHVLAENPVLFSGFARLSVSVVTRMLRAGHHPPTCLVLV